MEKLKELVTIANYLTTRYESKKHGGHNIYEDDKIMIAYDTYYPNVTVRIFDKGDWKLVLLRNGGGFNQVYHRGLWVDYATNVLYPKALEAKAQEEEAQKKEKEREHYEKFGDIDDAHIFANN